MSNIASITKLEETNALLPSFSMEKKGDSDFDRVFKSALASGFPDAVGKDGIKDAASRTEERLAKEISDMEKDGSPAYEGVKAAVLGKDEYLFREKGGEEDASFPRQEFSAEKILKELEVQKETDGAAETETPENAVFTRLILEMFENSQQDKSGEEKGESVAAALAEFQRLLESGVSLSDDEKARLKSILEKLSLLSPEDLDSLQNALKDVLPEEGMEIPEETEAQKVHPHLENTAKTEAGKLAEEIASFLGKVSEKGENFKEGMDKTIAPDTSLKTALEKLIQALTSQNPETETAAKSAPAVPFEEAPAGLSPEIQNFASQKTAVPVVEGENSLETVGNSGANDKPVSPKTADKSAVEQQAGTGKNLESVALKNQSKAETETLPPLRNMKTEGKEEATLLRENPQAQTKPQEVKLTAEKSSSSHLMAEILDKSQRTGGKILGVEVKESLRAQAEAKGETILKSVQADTPKNSADLQSALKNPGSQGGEDSLKRTSAKESGDLFTSYLKGAEESKGSLAKPLQTPGQAYDMKEARDISRFMRTLESAVAKGESKLTVTLSPENLGRLEIRLVESGGKITAKFFTDNETSHKMIISQGEAIRTQLGERGIVIDNMEFAFNDASEKREHGEGRRSAKSGNNKKSFGEATEDEDFGREVAINNNKGIYA